MGWKERRREQEAVGVLIQLLIAGCLIVCAYVAACSLEQMERATGAKIEQVDAQALFKKANALAMQEVLR